MGMIEEFIKAIHEISHYTGEDHHAVMSKVLNGTRLMADEWNASNPQTEKEILDFYRFSRSQIYGMVGYNYFNPSRYLLSVKIAEKCRGRVLDFGAGVGDNLIRLWERGLRSLTHADFAGYTRGFAAQRYAARGMKIELISSHELEGLFDCIICLDVVEHAFNPAAMLTQLASCLVSGGKIFLNVHFGRAEDHPMHFDRPVAFDEIACLTSLGVDRANILTARDLLIDMKKDAERPIAPAELKQLLRAFPRNLDLLLLCATVQRPAGAQTASQDNIPADSFITDVPALADQEHTVLQVARRRLERCNV